MYNCIVIIIVITRLKQFMCLRTIYLNNATQYEFINNIKSDNSYFYSPWSKKKSKSLININSFKTKQLTMNKGLKLITIIIIGFQ